MGPSRQHGGRAANNWIRTLTQRIGDGLGQPGQANQRADNEGVKIASQHWLELVPAHEEARAVRIGRGVQHAPGDLLDAFTSCYCCCRR